MATTEEIIKSLNDSFFAYLTSVNPTLTPESLEYKAIQGWCSAFSTSIGGAIEGGSSGVIPTDFLKKAGDSMIGKLSANYGFEAGSKNGIVSLSVVDRVGVSYIVANDDIDLIGKSIKYNGSNLVGVSGRSVLVGSNTEFDNVDFCGVNLINISSITVGEKLLISDSVFTYGGFDVYHSGNSNIASVDWSALNLSASGTLTVNGISTFNGSVNSNGGFSFKQNNIPVISSSINNELEVNNGVLIKNYSKILFESKKTSIFESNLGDLSISSYKLLLLEAGLGSTIRLMSSLSNNNGTLDIIDKFGKCNFVRGCDLGVNDVSTLSAVSYGSERTDKGIEILNFIKFKGLNTGVMSMSNNTVSLILGDGIAFGISKTNDFINLSTVSQSNKERYRFDRDVLCDTKFAIFNSASNATATYLGDKILYLGDNGDLTNLIGHYLMNDASGIKVNGDVIMDRFIIRNSNFSDGLSGSGIGVDFIKSTITTDFLVVRKKLRVIEFEVQKTSYTNGDLIISSACSGDYVTEII